MRTAILFGVAFLMLASATLPSSTATPVPIVDGGIKLEVTPDPHGSNVYLDWSLTVAGTGPYGYKVVRNGITIAQLDDQNYTDQVPVWGATYWIETTNTVGQQHTSNAVWVGGLRGCPLLITSIDLYFPFVTARPNTECLPGV